jgi:hypothetical protein
MRNYKLLKYSWETDPKVKAWKELSDKARAERQVEVITPFPTRHKINGEWVYPNNVKPKPKPTTKVPPDPRSVEQFNNDYFLGTCNGYWKGLEEKKHIKSIKEYKARIRKNLRDIHKLKQGYRNILGYSLEDLKEIARCNEYINGANDPKYTIHLFEYIDYVNLRFGLNIRKDILTDKEYEKSKLIVDVKPAKVLAENNNA